MMVRHQMKYISELLNYEKSLLTFEIMEYDIPYDVALSEYQGINLSRRFWADASDSDCGG